jgi:hypothetical protein
MHIIVSCQMLNETRQWLGERAYRVVGDGFYATLAGKDIAEATIVSRMRRDADLYDLAPKPSKVLECFADRWPIEDTFKNTKQFLGGQQPQTYKGKGPERAAGLSFFLYSIIWLWYLRQSPCKRYFFVQPWYCWKANPSFADALSCLRRELWQERIKFMFGNSAVHDKKFDFLLEALAPAA